MNIPSTFNGMQVVIKDAQQQARTPRDIRGAWVRPKVLAKRAGRKGTRRGWKRQHPPHYVYHYREPTDVLVLDRRMIIMTPQQADVLRRATVLR